MISACSQYHVKGQPRFPCLRQNSFPFAPMKTEQETNSGNRVQAQLPEPFLFPKTDAGNRKETMREQFGKHPREPFSGAVMPHRGNRFRYPHFIPHRIPCTASKRRNTRGSGPLEWVQKERTTAGNRAGNSHGNSIGNHDGTTMIRTVYPRGFPNREPGGGWGPQGEGGGKWRSIEGEKMDLKQHKQRSEYFAHWRANDFAP